MGYCYYIACKSCERFLDLGRWRVFHDLQFPAATKELFVGAGNVAAISVETSRLREHLDVLSDAFSLSHKGEPEFQTLVLLLREFSDKHVGHELYFINDSGDLPWRVCDCYPWFEWSEVIGPNTDMGRVDLPKNLVHDLNLRSWCEIERHLLRLPRYDPTTFPGDIALVEQGFEKIREELLSRQYPE